MSFQQNYTTTEKDTGKIDHLGNIIYQKTIVFGALPATAAKTVAHGLAAAALSFAKRIAIVDFWAVDDTADDVIFANHANITTLSIDDTNITVTTDADLSAYTLCNITIQYSHV